VREGNWELPSSPALTPAPLPEYRERGSLKNLLFGVPGEGFLVLRNYSGLYVVVGGIE